MARRKDNGLSTEERLHAALVPVEEQPYEVPENWVWLRIGEVCRFIGGGTPSKSNPDYWDGNIPWASVKDIKGSFLYETQDTITALGLENCAANVCDVNDLILVTRIEPGKTIIAKYATSINQDLKIVKSDIDSRFLHWFFMNAKEEFMARASGSTVLGITLDTVTNMPIPLPPLPEQHRIVERIKSLFAKLDAARDMAQNALESFETRQAAILHRVFTGELTKRWREEREPVINTVQEDIAKYALTLTQKDKSKIEGMLATSSWEMVDDKTQWLKCTIGAIGIVTNGSTPSRSHDEYWNGDIPWVSSGEVRNNIIAATNEKITKQGYENTSVKLLPAGTVLIAMIGEGKTRGQSAVLDIEATTNQNVAAIIIKHGFIEPRFLWYWLQKEYTRNREVGNGTGPQALNCQRVRELPFIIPSFPEQQEIVRILDTLFSQEQQARDLCDVLDKVDLMKKAILARAFRGELGTNDKMEENHFQYYLLKPSGDFDELQR